MASSAEKADATYTLYGFSNDLDWRRTSFLEPLPPSRFCTYCSRVCATMMMLPCCHVVCAGCYTQCSTRSWACALDGLSFCQQDVAVMPFNIPDLAARHIRCWNANLGCPVSGPSFLVLEHFHKECLYHSVSCSRCGQTMPHGDIVAHLALGCGPGKSQQPLFPQKKPRALLLGGSTVQQLEPETPAASRCLSAAGQDLRLTPVRRPKPKRGNVAPSLTALSLAGEYIPTTISPIVPSSGEAAKGPKTQSTIQQLWPETPAASRRLSAAGQDLRLTHDRRPKPERGNVAQSLTALSLAGEYIPTTISPIVPSSGEAAKGPKTQSTIQQLWPETPAASRRLSAAGQDLRLTHDRRPKPERGNVAQSLTALSLAGEYIPTTISPIVPSSGEAAKGPKTQSTIQQLWPETPAACRRLSAAGQDLRLTHDRRPKPERGNVAQSLTALSLAGEYIPTTISPIVPSSGEAAKGPKTQSTIQQLWPETPAASRRLSAAGQDLRLTHDRRPKPERGNVAQSLTALSLAGEYIPTTISPIVPSSGEAAKGPKTQSTIQQLWPETPAASRRLSAAGQDLRLTHDRRPKPERGNVAQSLTALSLAGEYIPTTISPIVPSSGEAAKGPKTQSTIQQLWPETPAASRRLSAAGQDLRLTHDRRPKPERGNVAQSLTALSLAGEYIPTTISPIVPSSGEAAKGPKTQSTIQQLWPETPAASRRLSAAGQDLRLTHDRRPKPERGNVAQSLTALSLAGEYIPTTISPIVPSSGEAAKGPKTQSTIQQLWPETPAASRRLSAAGQDLRLTHDRRPKPERGNVAQSLTALSLAGEYIPTTISPIVPSSGEAAKGPKTQSTIQQLWPETPAASRRLSAAGQDLRLTHDRRPKPERGNVAQSLTALSLAGEYIPTTISPIVPSSGEAAKGPKTQSTIQQLWPETPAASRRLSAAGQDLRLTHDRRPKPERGNVAQSLTALSLAGEYIPTTISPIVPSSGEAAKGPKTQSTIQQLWPETPAASRRLSAAGQDLRLTHDQRPKPERGNVAQSLTALSLAGEYIPTTISPIVPSSGEAAKGPKTQSTIQQLWPETPAASRRLSAAGQDLRLTHDRRPKPERGNVAQSLTALSLAGEYIPTTISLIVPSSGEAAKGPKTQSTIQQLWPETPAASRRLSAAGQDLRLTHDRRPKPERGNVAQSLTALSLAGEYIPTTISPIVPSSGEAAKGPKTQSTIQQLWPETPAASRRLSAAGQDLRLTHDRRPKPERGNVAQSLTALSLAGEYIPTTISPIVPSSGEAAKGPKTQSTIQQLWPETPAASRRLSAAGQDLRLTHDRRPKPERGNVAQSLTALSLAGEYIPTTISPIVPSSGEAAKGPKTQSTIQQLWPETPAASRRLSAAGQDLRLTHDRRPKPERGNVAQSLTALSLAGEYIPTTISPIVPSSGEAAKGPKTQSTFQQLWPETSAASRRLSAAGQDLRLTHDRRPKPERGNVAQSLTALSLAGEYIPTTISPIVPSSGEAAKGPKTQSTIQQLWPETPAASRRLSAAGQDLRLTHDRRPKPERGNVAQSLTALSLAGEYIPTTISPIVPSSGEAAKGPKTQSTIQQLWPETPAASRRLSAAGQDLRLTHDRRPKPERGNVAQSLTALSLAGEYIPTTISPIVPSSGEAAKGPKTHSDKGGKPVPAADSYTPAAVARYLYEQLPSADDYRPSDLLTGRKTLSFCSEAELTDNLLCLSPTVEQIPDPPQEGSVRGREVASASNSASPETAPPGSHQYPHVAAILTSGTLSMFEPNSSGKGARPKTKTHNTASERVEHTSEGETAPTQESAKTEQSNPSEDRPAVADSNSSPEGSSGKEAEAPVSVSVGAERTSASSSANGDSLSPVLHGYLNEIGRLVRLVVLGMDVVREALGELMPEELVLVLKVCETARAHLKGDSTLASAVADQIKRGTTQVLHAAEKYGNTTDNEEAISQEYVTEKIERLLSVGKHVLRQRIRVSVPVQWYLEGWSVLKDRALSVGEAADYIHDISTQFFGYVLVPGLMLENAAGVLRLRFCFYVRRGIYDNFLEWPLDKKLTLSILHPNDRGKVRALTVDTKRDLKEKCIKPGSEITKPSLSSKSVKADYFDMNGYVSGDKLLLKFEAK